MALTFINLTNELLRKFHKVEIASADFSAPTPSVHKTAKDAVVNAVAFINNTVDTWPFNASTAEILCVAGTQEYTSPANMKAIDWRSFKLQDDTSLNVNADVLEFISWDKYLRYYYAIDNAATTAADFSVPKYVYRTPSNNIGITPKPDQAYTIEYTYYTIPATLSASTDITNIPDRFKYVIIDKAATEMCDGLDNIEMQNKFFLAAKDGIRTMRKQLINDDVTEMLVPKMNTGHTRGGGKYVRI